MATRSSWAAWILEHKAAKCMRCGSAAKEYDFGPKTEIDARMRSHDDRVVCHYMKSELRGSEKGDTTTTFSLIDYCGAVIWQLAQKDRRRSFAFEELFLADIGKVSSPIQAALLYQAIKTLVLHETICVVIHSFR